MSHGAGCLCGAVRVAIDAEPLLARACWCRLCQYLAAGNATVNVVFPADAVTAEGEVRWYASVADSGNQMHRGFCPQCGTQIFSKSDARPNLLIVRSGALDDPDLLAPQATIWTSAAPAWACFDPELPRFERQPPPIG
ncbi:GFA family protein [Sphingomonas sp. LB-2]|uniref:GFA family protein n=1 Tax=Sphingomonas caeni TaxID=2984949 RepID=UPI00222F6BDB|nr:GFA family protein [Sphingomonas caeni]MCW3847855.1 GFA family protein [Sphingomonas caeni]